MSGQRTSWERPTKFIFRDDFGMVQQKEYCKTMIMHFERVTGLEHEVRTNKQKEIAVFCVENRLPLPITHKPKGGQ